MNENNEKSPVEIILEEADDDIENGKKDLINDGRNRFCFSDDIAYRVSNSMALWMG